MALFGRESEATQHRAETVRAWVAARAPASLFCVMFGVVALLDFFTLILGVAFGVAATVAGFIGLRDIEKQPELLGRRLCLTGITMGLLGLVLSLVMWLIVYPALQTEI